MSALLNLVREAGDELGAVIVEEDGELFVTIPIEADDVTDHDENDGERSQELHVYGSEDSGAIIVSCELGVAPNDLDFADILRVLRTSVFTRVYLTEQNDDGDEALVVEAGTAYAGVTADIMSWILKEVADVANEVETLIG